MSEQVIHIIEAEPGIVHITTEALHDLLTFAGYHKRGEHEYVIRDKPTARPPHPATMIGRK